MPILEIERLDSTSSDAQKSAALSSCVAAEMQAGREQDQAVAMCHQMIADKTGGAKTPEEKPL